MKQRIFAVMLGAALGACNPQQAEQAPAEAETLVSGLAIENMDKSIRPGDDFFMYMNGAWIDQTEIPADKGSYGGPQILDDESQENVKAIIDEAASGDFEKGTDEQKIGDLYNAYMDMDTRNAKGIEPLRKHLERIAGIANLEDLARYIAHGRARGLTMPIDLDQLADWNDSSKYSIIITQGGLGLPDREYYLLDDDKSVQIREAYVEHIGRTFDLAGLADGAAAARTVLALETRLAEHNMPKEQVRDRAAVYNVFSRDQWTDVMPNFPWQAFVDAYGLPEIDTLVFFMPDYLAALDDILLDTGLEPWKVYLTWNELRSAAHLLTADLDQQNFAFYGTVLAGIEEQRPRWRRATNTVSGSLGEVIGKVYVDRHFPPEAKRRMEELVGNLIKAYEVSISELDWMTDATKEEALRKLSKFEAKVGYPDEWKDYSAVTIEPDDLFGNLERAALVEHQRQMDRHYGPVDRGEWRMTPQTVNAYYSAALNQIVFPAAILQPPIFNLEADDAVNYGAIGAVIGHEIGHGFDDQGSTFDGDGVLRNWWTDEDRAEFEKRTGALVAQYDSFRPFDDLAVNGEFTQGENIGDLGGIMISLLAYQLSLDGREPPVIDGFTGIQRVLLGYAQLWRSKMRDELLRQVIATDPHAPAQYRANGAVRNIPEWYEAFDVQPGDALYLPPEERVKIW